MKSVRNNLLKNDILFEDGQASWVDIINLLKLDSRYRSRAAPRLSTRHVFPSNFDKMKVKLAAQVFSHSVSSALRFYAKKHAIPSKAKGTAQICTFFDKLFDSVTGSSFLPPKSHRRGLTEKSQSYDFLRNSVDFLTKLKFVNRSTRKPVDNIIHCVRGWILTINSVLSITDDLFGRGVKFVFPRRLNQDNLEHFYGQIRQGGGSVSYTHLTLPTILRV